MARWSDAIALQQYYHWRKDTNHPGVYEIGFVRSGEFNPKYVGKSSKSIYDRLKKHWNEKGSKNIVEYYKSRVRDNLYFHFIVTENYDAMERNLLNRHEIGRDEGLYEWNRKYEDS